MSGATPSFKLNRVESRVGPIALVTVDNGEDHRKPTTLGSSAFESAVAVVDALESGDWAALVLTGKPFVFCVGADVDEFSQHRVARAGAPRARAPGTSSSPGSGALPFPTVAAINGACLGGGLELALHCDARTIAANVRHVGFPEVALSIIPAWGGTQLVPKLAGPEAAVRLIVTNPLRQNRLLDGRRRARARARRPAARAGGVRGRVARLRDRARRAGRLGARGAGLVGASETILRKARARGRGRACTARRGRRPSRST